MHVRRIKDWPKLGDLVISNSATYKKYVVVGFDHDFKEGRFGSREVAREVVILRYLGSYYASGKVVKPKVNPYRRIDKKEFDWMQDYTSFSGQSSRMPRNHSYGYSVVERIVGGYVRGTRGLNLT